MHAVRHRGPDGDGLEVFTEGDEGWAPGGNGELALGHLRLAIVDLSEGGHQPMADPQRRYWITYNGEIYNYRELRAELQAKGHAFHTESDTEVLLRSYLEWGADCLQRFNGIFAFAIFDTREGQLFAARDRFGVKPLYWWRHEDWFAFGSEIKQFLSLPGFRARLNGARAYDFLNWNLSDHTAETLFGGVMQLRGGEFVRGSLEQFRSGDVRSKAWYQLRPDPSAAGAGAREAAQRFRELLEDSVALELRADVPVGSCLSGGLDSSSIVCVAAGLLRSQAGAAQHAFSARASVPAYDEGRYIEEVVRSTGVQSHEVIPPLGDLFRLLPQVTWHQDEPFGSTSIYAQWHVFALARSANVKVLLDGQGADEMLAGYHGFFGPYLAGLLRSGRWTQLAGEMRKLQEIHGYGRLHALSRMADTLLPDALRQLLRPLAGRSAAAPPDWLAAEVLQCELADPFARLGGRSPDLREVSRMQLVASNLPMLLHCEDRNSMAHGVEARVPFLDHRLVEFCLGLPDDAKIREGMTKRVLRDAMTGVLPEAVRTRTDKLGFVTPEEVWVKREAPTAFREALERAVEVSAGVVRPSVLNGFDEVIAGRRRFSHEWWRVISFGAWMERFAVTG